MFARALLGSLVPMPGFRMNLRCQFKVMKLSSAAQLSYRNIFTAGTEGREDVGALSRCQGAVDYGADLMAVVRELPHAHAAVAAAFDALGDRGQFFRERGVGQLPSMVPKHGARPGYRV